MLFNSYVFIFLFLPSVLGGFYLIGRRGNLTLAVGWLFLASLVFYAYWSPYALLLILSSLTVNFVLSRRIVRSGPGSPNAKVLTTLGVAVNLAVLGYFKYTLFFLTNLNELAGAHSALPTIVLPLAISFYTFQQIAFLVDTYKGKVDEPNLLHYCAFVTFFPHLIAGPIVQHRYLLPRFKDANLVVFKHENLSIGITIFAMGLFKKVVLADGIAPYATPVFSAAESGATLDATQAWTGVLAYTFQIYFDFSGYSDMAIGLARMFGIVFPLNFDSPYKSANIIDFWRRWHMTLSRFLRDYVYFPLGGNRKGPSRRYANLMAVMLLGGLWHGAGWTFVVWGGLHGLYLAMNHAWHGLRELYTPLRFAPTRIGTFVARTTTFLAVVFAWVFFRAESFAGAVRILEGMFGLNGIQLHETHLAKLNNLFGLGDWAASAGVQFDATNAFFSGAAIARLSLLLLVCWYLPNTQELLAKYRPAEDVPAYQLRATGVRGWEPSLASAFVVTAVLAYSLSVMTSISEFLYFQF